MADRFWRGGTATWDGTAGSKWAATAGGATGALAPTSGDDVYFDSTSTGTVTIASGQAARSIDCNGFSGTWSWSNYTILIGDGTAGANNRILRMSATMVTSGNTGGHITLQSTSTTQQSVDMAGKFANGNLTFAGAGSNYAVVSSTGGGVVSVVHSAGTLDLSGGIIVSNGGGFTSNSGSTRTLTLGSGGITVAGNFTITTSGLTFTQSSSTITMTGANLTFAGAGLSYGTVQWTGSTMGTASITGANTMTNLKLTPSVGAKNDSLSVGATQTVSTNFTVTGTSRANQILVYGSIVGTPQTISAAAVTLTNVDFMDITGSGAATWSGTMLGDCQGNSGITFEPAQPQFWIGGTGSQSSATKYSQSTGGANDGRIPLPQDNLTFDGSSGSGTVTFDMARIAANLDMSASSVLTVAESTVTTLGHSVFGNVSFNSGMTITLSSDAFNLRGRSAQTFTTNTSSIAVGAVSVTINAPNGTYTLQDALTITGTTGGINLLAGTLNTNDKAVSTPTFSCTGSLNRGLTMGTTTWTVTYNANAVTLWNVLLSGGTVNFSCASGTVVIGSTATIARSFVGGLNFSYGTLTYTLSGSTGALQIGSTGTIGTINFSDASNIRTLQFVSSTTTTITNAFNVNGNSSFLMSVIAVTSGTFFTLTKTSGTVACDYLSIKDSHAGGGARWYAGANSTSVSGNTGWIFTAPQNNRMLMGVGS